MTYRELEEKFGYKTVREAAERFDNDHALRCRAVVGASYIKGLKRKYTKGLELIITGKVS